MKNGTNHNVHYILSVYKSCLYICYCHLVIMNLILDIEESIKQRLANMIGTIYKNNQQIYHIIQSPDNDQRILGQNVVSIVTSLLSKMRAIVRMLKIFFAIFLSLLC